MILTRYWTSSPCHTGQEPQDSAHCTMVEFQRIIYNQKLVLVLASLIACQWVMRVLIYGLVDLNFICPFRMDSMVLLINYDWLVCHCKVGWELQVLLTVAAHPILMWLSSVHAHGYGFIIYCCLASTIVALSLQHCSYFSLNFLAYLRFPFINNTSSVILNLL